VYDLHCFTSGKINGYNHNAIIFAEILFDKRKNGFSKKAPAYAGAFY